MNFANHISDVFMRLVKKELTPGGWRSLPRKSAYFRSSARNSANDRKSRFAKIVALRRHRSRRMPSPILHQVCSGRLLVERRSARYRFSLAIGRELVESKFCGDFSVTTEQARIILPRPRGRATRIHEWARCNNPPVAQFLSYKDFLYLRSCVPNETPREGRS
jgi:hypothetical protein